MVARYRCCGGGERGRKVKFNDLIEEVGAFFQSVGEFIQNALVFLFFGFFGLIFTVAGYQAGYHIVTAVGLLALAWPVFGVIVPGIRSFFGFTLDTWMKAETSRDERRKAREWEAGRPQREAAAAAAAREQAERKAREAAEEEARREERRAENRALIAESERAALALREQEERRVGLKDYELQMRVMQRELQLKEQAIRLREREISLQERELRLERLREGGDPRQEKLYEQMRRQDEAQADYERLQEEIDRVRKESGWDT